MQNQKIQLARRIFLIAFSIAWLTPVAVAFLPWSISEKIIQDFVGITVNFTPILKYWFVMAAMISGMIGCIFIYLLFDTQNKLKIMAFMGVFHIILGIVLLTRGLLLKADSLIVIWDSSFCIIAGICITILSLIKF